MERHRITADDAFGYLTRVSQAENTKLAAIAAQLVATGELPIATSPDPMHCWARWPGYPLRLGCPAG